MTLLYNGDEVMQRGWKWNGNPPDHSDPGDGSGIFDETLREPFPWYKAGPGPGQPTWFASRFDLPNDGVSVEEQAPEHGMLHLVRGLTNFRSRHPTFANGDMGAILTDSKDWLVFERLQGDDRYVVLINTTANGNSYRFHEGWFPQYVGAKLLFWSDGVGRKWVDESSGDKHIEGSVYVAPYGLVVLQRRTN
ncbi:MAG: hypothetical protein L0387_39230 [Acidobacteria bacterium]|nr:hypothetical protein [Acidobacteriota bacterium]